MLFATHMLLDETKYLWDNTRQRLERVDGAAIPRITFNEDFLEKCFLVMSETRRR